MESLGKRWNCFPTLPTTLEIDKADFHIPTATTTTRINFSLKPAAKGYAF